jgi:hypothetical protein
MDIIERQDLIADYDRTVDVLYLTLGGRKSVEGTGLPGGVELDYALESGEPCGVTVIGYARNGWADRACDLADVAARHLSVGSAKILTAIRVATR